jgi:ferrous iron transport protein B
LSVEPLLAGVGSPGDETFRRRDRRRIHKADRGLGELRVALVGNPNSGKTTLFNALTGLRQKVGNYPGVTVERKLGGYRFDGNRYTLVDLPGTYSLNAESGDERVVRDLLLGLLPSEPLPAAIVAVVDASHLERHLFLATQAMQLGIPVVIALTMVDEAKRHGRVVDAAKLSAGLGVPVVAVVAPSMKGIDTLRRAVAQAAADPPPESPWALSPQLLDAVDGLTELLPQLDAPLGVRRHLALQLLLDERGEHPLSRQPALRTVAAALRSELDSSGFDWRSDDARSRNSRAGEIAARALSTPEAYKRRRSDVVDAIVTHPLAGLAIFVAVMAVVFQAVFSWAPPISAMLERAIAWAGHALAAALPAGPLQSLLVDGVIGGVGAVIVFLPQIAMLFLFLALLEDSGYMARAAFLMNRHMRRAGLHGKAFVPLLAGFACAVPGIMAARTIAEPRERLVTMLVVPLISCSARLPVYMLMISAFVPPTHIVGAFTWQGLVLVSAYMLSLVAAITAAWVLRKTLLKGETQPFILELPPYRMPNWRTVLGVLWTRAGVFVTQAGTVILAINILLWFLVAFPVNARQAALYDAQRVQIRVSALGAEQQAAELAAVDRSQATSRLSNSFAGRMGHAIEPVIRPLGFDWKIGVGLIASFAAREVIISTLAVIYGIGDSAGPVTLKDAMRADINPRTGKPVFNLIVSLNVVLFFILACQCMATVATVRRESNSWRWPLFLIGYMTVLAYVACFVFYQVASRLFPGAA